MKRIRRAFRQVRTAKSCVLNSKHATKWQQMEQECDRFFTLSSDILAIVRFDRYFKRISPASERILGFSQDELLATPFLEFVHPDDRAATLAVVQKLMAGERVDDFENRYCCKDGSYKWLSWSGIGDVEEKLIYCTARDTTQHKQLEIALQESEARFRAFMQHSPVAAWITDINGQMLQVNPRWLQIVQLATEEVVGKNLFDIFSPELAQQYFDNNHWVSQSSQVTELIESAPAADGRVGEYLVYKFPIEQPDGCKLIGGVAVDITELKRAEAALRDSEARFRQIAENIHEVFWVAALDLSEMIYISPAYEEVWGRTCQSLYEQPRSFIESIHPEDRSRVMAVLEQQRQTGFSHEYRIVQPNGRIRWIWEQGFTVNDSAGIPYRVVGISQDITDRKQAEEALQYQREQEQLVVSIAQHIRQSLDLNQVLDATVTEVRRLLKADRVLLYWVNPNGLGCVITESVASGYAAILDKALPPEIFPPDCHQLYRQGRIRKITDIETDELAACLAETLRQFGVRSKLVVPILQGENLWGLLIAHQCSGPREWQSHEVDLLQQLAIQVAIAIQQAELHQQVQQLNASLEMQVQERTLELQQALNFEALLKRITDKVRDSLDETQILQTAVQELAIGLNIFCCDVALYDFEQGLSTIQCEYMVSGVSAVKSPTFSFSNLSEVYDRLLQGENVHFCMVATPFFWRQGTDPHLTVLSCPLMDDQAVLGDLWLFRPGEECFSTSEIRLIEQVANQCAIALRQSRLYQAAQTQVVELERLNHLKDDFLNTVSHELRTPMCNIKMAIQMLELTQPQINESNPKFDRTNRYFNILRNECQREISLINDLLDLTRLEAGTEPLNLATIDLQAWIPHVLESFEHRICNQQQQLHVYIPATLPPITTDLSYLERILTELLNNASKYTPAEGVITVSAEVVSEDKNETPEKTSTDSVVITVCNSGVEIPGSELERIFDKFYRIPNHDPWKHGGTGLGLALVKRLVERMNGKIEVNSYHKQTIFTIQLPLVLTDILSG